MSRSINNINDNVLLPLALLAPARPPHPIPAALLARSLASTPLNPVLVASTAPSFSSAATGPLLFLAHCLSLVRHNILPIFVLSSSSPLCSTLCDVLDALGLPWKVASTERAVLVDAALLNAHGHVDALLSMSSVDAFLYGAKKVIIDTSEPRASKSKAFGKPLPSDSPFVDEEKAFFVYTSDEIEAKCHWNRNSLLAMVLLSGADEFPGFKNTNATVLSPLCTTTAKTPSFSDSIISSAITAAKTMQQISPSTDDTHSALQALHASIQELAAELTTNSLGLLKRRRPSAVSEGTVDALVKSIPERITRFMGVTGSGESNPIVESNREHQQEISKRTRRTRKNKSGKPAQEETHFSSNIQPEEHKNLASQRRRKGSKNEESDSLPAKNADSNWDYQRVSDLRHGKYISEVIDVAKIMGWCKQHFQQEWKNIVARDLIAISRMKVLMENACAKHKIDILGRRPKRVSETTPPPSGSKGFVSSYDGQVDVDSTKEFIKCVLDQRENGSLLLVQWMDNVQMPKNLLKFDAHAEIDDTFWIDAELVKWGSPAAYQKWLGRMSLPPSAEVEKTPDPPSETFNLLPIQNPNPLHADWDDEVKCTSVSNEDDPFDSDRESDAERTKKRDRRELLKARVQQAPRKKNAFTRTIEELAQRRRPASP